MSIVKYCYATDMNNISKINFTSLDILAFEPILYLKYYEGKKDKLDRENDYFHCPSFLEFFKNTYVIRSPIDLNVKFYKKECYLEVGEPIKQEYFDFAFKNRSNEKIIMLTLPPDFIFISDDDVIMETVPIFLDHSPLSKIIRLIPGTFNISKWVRPIDFTFEVVDENVDENILNITIKRGDPLFCVRFKNSNNTKINLERVFFDKKIYDAAVACVSVKQFQSKLSLKQLYEMAENSPLLKKIKTKKCPFNFLTKNKK